MSTKNRTDSDPDRARGGRPSLYRWDDWFARGRFVLRRGEHFHCGQGAMVQQVRNAARDRGVTVKIVEGWGDITVIVVPTVDDDPIPAAHRSGRPA